MYNWKINETNNNFSPEDIEHEQNDHDIYMTLDIQFPVCGRQKQFLWQIDKFWYHKK